MTELQWLLACDRWAKALGIARRVDLRWSSQTSVPAVLGIWRPTILLPVRLGRGVAPDSTATIVLHELAHVRRGDFAWNLALKLVQAFYWPHPLVWLMGKVIAGVRERACDDLCIRAAGSAESYRETLLFVAEGLTRRPDAALGMAMARGSGLRGRLWAVNSSTGADRCLLHAPVRLATIAIVSAIAAGLGAVTLTQAATRVRADEPKRGGIDFRVVAKGTNTPIPKAEVHVYTHGKDTKLIADENGRVVVPLPQTSDYDFSVVALVEGFQETAVRFSNIYPRFGPYPDAKIMELPPGELTVGGTVVDESGKPIPRTTVALRGMREGQNWLAFKSISLKTGADGRWASSSMPADLSKLEVSVHHPEYTFDYVAADLNSLKGRARSHTIIVRPWGRLEGVVFKVGKPAAQMEVTLSEYDRAPSSLIDLMTSVVSDEAGRFVIEKLVPGAWVVVDQSGNRVYVDVKPGETTRITLKNSGRSVLGRIVMSDGGGAEQRAVAGALGSGMVTIQSDKPRVPFPPGLPVGERTNWFRTWQSSPAGQAYLRSYVTRSAKVSSGSGAFQFEGLPPGEYVLTFTLDEVVDGGLRASSKASTHFRIGPVLGDGTDEPLDLGVIAASKVEVAKELRVGDRAPGFSIKTVDGKSISLDEFKGKYVLLDFWATWCGPCIGQLPELRALHEKYGNDPRFAMISLSLDENVEAATKFLESNPCPWTQAFLGAWNDEERVSKSYGVQGIPALFLIGPDGTIQSQLMRGDSVRERVEGALNR